MKNYSVKKWFWIGFGIRAVLAVVVFLMMIRTFEAGMLYLADLPTMAVVLLAQMTLPDSWFKALVEGDPFYLPFNLLGCLLWGGIFTLVPITRNFIFRFRRKHQTVN